MIMLTSTARPGVTRRLQELGLRPTRQRVGLAALLLGGPSRHVTAEQLHAEAERRAIKVSLATIYNTLHQFTAAGLLREVVVEPGRSYFDTNTDEHHHFYCETSGRLQDIASASLSLNCLPQPPAGSEIRRVEVIIRIGPART